MNAAAYVGIAAIVASAIFNVLTLKRSTKTLALAEQSYQAAESRYRVDQARTRNDRLRGVLIDVAFGVGDLNFAITWYIKLVHDFLANNATVNAAQNQDVEKVRPASFAAFRAVKMGLLLSEDGRITGVLGDIEAQLLAITRLMESHGTTSVTFGQASAVLEQHMHTAAQRSSELLDLAREVLGEPNAEG